MPSSFLRAAGFDYNVRLWTDGAVDGVVSAPNVDVRLPVVDPADIAAAAVALLTADDPAPAAYTITGPENLSVRDQIGVLNRVLGRSWTVREVAESEVPLPEPVLETMGPAAAVLSPTDDVRRLTGSPARTFEQWARAAFEQA